MNYVSPVRAAVHTRLVSLKIRKVALLMATLAASAHIVPSITVAQTAATGSITGRVLNATNGMYLPNVRVAVEGSNIETFTNQFGEYTLNNVPAGQVSLRATFTGQQPQVTTVAVVADAAATQNITFNATDATQSEDGTLMLNEFTVAANRFKNAQEIAINEQRTAVNIKNVISVDQFGDIPSGNVGELVKFLPGVQIDYGSFGGNNQGYSDNDASGISVRGFGADDTAVLIDGLPVSNATPGTLSRQVALDQLSINNASRVELIKVATPDMPANSLGGQVNLITKSAFEYARPSYTGRVFLNINSHHTEFKKTPGPVKDSTYKTTPGIELTVTVPVNQKFGFSVTASAVNDANQSYRGTPTYTLSGNSSITNASGPISLSNPLLSRYQVTDSSSYVERRSANLRLDWKPTQYQTLRTNFQYSTYDSEEAQRRLDARPNIAATSGTVTGTDWGPTYTRGSTNNSTLDMTVTTRDKQGETKSGQAQYTYQRAGWNIAAAGSISVSTGEYNDRDNGHFSELGLKLNPGQVNLDNIQDGGIPHSITTYNRVSNGGGIRDYTNLSNYGFDGTIAKSGEATSKNTVSLYKIDVERDLSFLPFLGSNSMSVKVGYRHDEEKVEKSGLGTNYREILRPGASYTVADILDTYYLGQTPGFGLPSQQWGSTYKLFELNAQNNLFYVPDFDEPTNTRVENYASYVGQQKSMTETTTGYYAMLSGRFFDNRLSLVGGLRQEESKREGYGPYTDNEYNYLKVNGRTFSDSTYTSGVQIDVGNGSIDANGNYVPPSSGTPNRPIFANNAAGIALRNHLTSQGIAFPTQPLGPVANSLATKMLQLQPNRYTYGESKGGDPSYSINSAFKLTKKIDLKVAYSRAFGRPDLEATGPSPYGLLSGNGQFVINDYSESERAASPGGYYGEIKVANPNLLPEQSENWDFSVAYYTDSGGQLSAGYYMKDVTNQGMTFVTDQNSPTFAEVLNAIGLDLQSYSQYKVSTSTNSSTIQKTSGWEFEARQDFGFLGRWGQKFQAFASYSFTNLADPATPVPYEINGPTGPVTLVPSVSTIQKRANRFGGAGLQFSGNRFSAQIRGVYRNENEVSRTNLANGNFLRKFQPEETRIDVTLNYILTKRYSLFLSGRDVFNAERKEILKDDMGLYPSYAETADIRDFGVVWSVGVTGRF